MYRDKEQFMNDCGLNNGRKCKERGFISQTYPKHISPLHSEIQGQDRRPQTTGVRWNGNGVGQLLWQHNVGIETERHAEGFYSCVLYRQRRGSVRI